MNSWLIAEILTLSALAAWLGALATGAIAWSSQTAPESIIRQEALARRRQNFWFRTFEPCIAPLTQLNDRYRGRTLEAIRHAVSSGLSPSEQLAVWQVRSATIGIAAGLLVHGIFKFSTFASTCVAVVTLISALSISVRMGRSRSLKRKRQIQSRLPFVLELMSLLMDAGGADPDQALRTAAEENHDHPIGELLNQLVQETDRGSGLAEAIVPWAEESGEEDLIDVAVVIRTSEERGTKLDESLRALAEQSHIRRIERLEQAAEEARVHISWPGFLVLIGCLLIAGAPLVLTAHDVLKDTPIYSAFGE